jgi:hypothetical protein
MKVFVYRNLHKKCYSVRCEKTKKVIAHVNKIQLMNCLFKVSVAGRERVRRERKKNVHAGVLGEWNGDTWGNYDTKGSVKVTYNPYQYDTFVFAESKQAINSAPIVELDELGIKIATLEDVLLKEQL